MSLRRQYERDGYAHLTGVVSDIAGLRADVSRETWTEPQPDAIEFAPIRATMLSPMVLKIARELLGKDLVYYGESAVRYETKLGDITLNPYRYPHQDAPIPMLRPFMAARFAVYFSDFTKGPGALRVWPGSHIGRRWSAQDTAPPWVDLESKPGDLVIWNLRTQHSAGPQEGTPLEPRNSIIWDFGAAGEDTDWYIDYRVKGLGKRVHEASGKCLDDPAVYVDCIRAGVELRRDIVDARRALVAA